LSTDLARAVAQALTAPSATLWMGGAELHAVGVWPETYDVIEPTTLTALHDSAVHHVRAVRRGGAIVGAIGVDRSRENHLSLAEGRLFDDLASQASLVIEHIGLADVITRQRQAGHLDGLSARERQVLELMARGMSNTAMCDELHLSIKTVEPIVSAIFTKLGLHPDVGSNRRVLAVLAYLRT
jgi:DNA-binding NarL/FixJ family response regulator